MATWQNASLSPIRVLVANGHTLLRQALRGLLEAEGFDVVGETADGQTVVDLAEQTGADVILLDRAIPRGDSTEILRELSTAQVPARTLLLTNSMEREEVVHALSLGAYGVIQQEATGQQLFDSIRCVMAGQYWVGRDNVSDLVKALQDEKRADEILPSRRLSLTRREQEIVRLVVTGYTNRDIAQSFSISVQTVKHHISNIFDKKGVSNRLELALYAVNHQLFADSNSNISSAQSNDPQPLPHRPPTTPRVMELRNR
jgi:two-component system, NarL family, nitrate/nitrite response regulator NarL